jgi:hypothetical protein
MRYSSQPVAQPEVRRSVHQGVWLGCRGTSRYRRWLAFYNNERPHQALDYRTPSQVFGQAKACGHVDNARGVAHMPTVEQQKAEASRINLTEDKERKGLNH